MTTVLLALGAVIIGAVGTAWGPLAGLAAGLPLCCLAAWLHGRRERRRAEREGEER